MAKADKWLKPKNLEKITEWAADKGNTVAIIARKIDIHPATFYRWLEKYPEIKEAFENGRRCIDEEVESSFFRMCTGYKETVREYIKVRGGEGEELVPIEKEIYIPPSVPAIIFYLCNRLPDKWKKESKDITAYAELAENTGVVFLPDVIACDVAAEESEGADNSNV